MDVTIMRRTMTMRISNQGCLATFDRWTRQWHHCDVLFVTSLVKHIYLGFIRDGQRDVCVPWWLCMIKLEESDTILQTHFTTDWNKHVRLHPATTPSSIRLNKHIFMESGMVFLVALLRERRKYLIAEAAVPAAINWCRGGFVVIVLARVLCQLLFCEHVMRQGLVVMGCVVFYLVAILHDTPCIWSSLGLILPHQKSRSDAGKPLFITGTHVSSFWGPPPTAADSCAIPLLPHDS